MNWNYEKLFIKKETTPWVAEVWTNVFPVVSNSIDTVCEIEKIEQIEWSMYGPTRSVLWKKRVWWSIDAYATPAMTWFVLNSIFWDPNTVDNWDWTYTHEFDYENNTTPSYTIESTKWNHVVRTSWNKVNDFTMSVDWAKLRVSANVTWQYWTSVNQINSYDDTSWDITLMDSEHFYAVWDSIDVYDQNWSIIYAWESIVNVNWNKVAISTWLVIPWWSSITLAKRTWSLVNEEIFQFLSKTNVSLNWVNTPIRTFTINATNNIDTEAWFQSWSSYTQSVNTKLRNATWTLTVDTDYAISLLAWYWSWSQVPVQFEITTRNWDNDLLVWEKITITWNIQLDSATTDISTNTDLTTPISFSFTDLWQIDLQCYRADLNF